MNDATARAPRARRRHAHARRRHARVARAHARGRLQPTPARDLDANLTKPRAPSEYEGSEREAESNGRSVTFVAKPPRRGNPVTDVSEVSDPPPIILRQHGPHARAYPVPFLIGLWIAEGPYAHAYARTHA